MKYGAMIVGILAGFLSLQWLGLLGSLFGGAMNVISPQLTAGGLDGDQIRLLSTALPLLTIAGGAICGASPGLGGVILLASAFGHYFLLGFHQGTEILVLSTGLAGVLGILATFGPDVAVPSMPTSAPAAAAQRRARANARMEADLERLFSIFNRPIVIRRLAAAAVDGFIVYGGLSIIWPVSLERYTDRMGFYFVVAAALLSYKTLLEGSAWHATIGKRLLGLQVLGENGATLTLIDAAKRSWPAVLPFIGMLLNAAIQSPLVPLVVNAAAFAAFISFAFNASERGVQDRLAYASVSLRPTTG